MAKPVWTNTQIIDQLDSGSRWSGTNLTYGFPTNANWTPYDEKNGFSPLNASQKTAATLAITLWDQLIVPNFTLAADGTTANIKYSNTTTSIGYAHAYYPGGGYPDAGSVWFNPQYGANSGTNNLVTPTVGQWGFSTYIHETGHALGLNHPGDYNGGSPTYANDALYVQDSQQYTIMSYFDASDTGADWVASNGKLYFAQTPMMDDIMTIQAMYGADPTTRVGNTTYGFNANVDVWLFDFTQNAHPVVCIYDAGGIDTLNLSGWNSACVINLAPGSFSNADMMTYNISIARNTWIENAVGGGGNDTLIGNILANQLDGGRGNDMLTGSDGQDVFIYSTSYGADVITDFIVSGSGADLIDLTGYQSITSYSALLAIGNQSGSSTVFTFSSGNMLTLQNVSLSTLAATDFVFYSGSSTPPPPDPPPPGGSGVTITGTSGNDTIDATHAPAGQAFATNYNDTVSGLAGNDVISGLDGDDTLEGGAGTDQVNGGNGNDKFLVSGSTNDVSDTFTGGAGTDTIQVTGSGALTLGGFNAATSSIESWLGNGQALLGNTSANTFDFTGLTSASGLSYVDGGSGNDTIRGGALVHDLRGGSGNDSLFGGDGDDTLTGGSGTDNMSAGGGNDRFLVSGSDAASDTFNGGSGTDTMQVTGSGSLSLNGFNASTSSIETWQGNSQAVTGSTAANAFDFSGLTAMSGLAYVDGGSGNDTLVGSAFADDLRGGSGNDRLTGGTGNDMLRGGSGTDTLTFGPGFGQDKILDFALNGSSADVIQFTAGTFANFNAVKAAMQQVGSDVVITLDASNTVTIANVSMSQLQANDFLFS